MRPGAVVALVIALGVVQFGVAGLSAMALDASRVTEELEHHGFVPLPGRSSLEVPFEFEGRRGRNVIAYLPPSDGGGEASQGAAILIGTHFADAEPDPGAVLLTAKKLAAASLRHAVVIAFWSDGGEPRDGSRAFVEQALFPAERLLACVHLDRMGSVPGNRIDVLGAGSSPVWRGLVERANVPVGFDVRVQDDPLQPTDSYTFDQAAVPAITLSRVAEEDLPAPSAGAVTPEYEEVDRAARFAALLVRKLDRLEERPEHVVFEREPHKPALAKQSAYTGTIPDYVAQVEGVLLSGVVEGGPAAKAGLAAGDVIVEFAGVTVSDIYAYRDALEGVGIGKPIEVVFIREGERKQAIVVPTARP